MAETWNLSTSRLLLDVRDEATFRRWAIENRYADSAYAFRRLLEAAGLRDAMLGEEWTDDAR